MDKLLIIADDFTGSLDTGIQFTKMGIKARIVTEHDYDLSLLNPEEGLLAVNTDSRPLSPQESYDRIYSLVRRAIKSGFYHFYKKTDSGLRGNIGMELKAVMDAAKSNVISFIPALPALNRITKNGIQYIDGIPVKDSVFGQDPFEPVIYSDVKDIIRSQAAVNVVKISGEQYDNVSFEFDEPTVLLFDAETDGDLFKIASLLKQHEQTSLIAGCAGFAQVYDSLLSFDKGNENQMLPSKGLLALCGSVNPITISQLDYAQEHGFMREHLSNEQKLTLNEFSVNDRNSFINELFDRVRKSDCYIVDSLDESDEQSVESFAEKLGLSRTDIRFRIAENLGRIAMLMVEKGLDYTISMTGGDTLIGFMHCIGSKELVPVCEIGKGAVLSTLNLQDKSIQVISKSGGFGSENIFVQMYEKTRQAVPSE